MINSLPIEQVSIKLLPSPYENNIWGTDKMITLRGVKHCLINNIFKTKSFDVAHRNFELWGANGHEQRVAFLIANPDQTPISLDVGVFYFNNNFMQDGYHRLAAAIYKNDTHIPAYISGNVEIIKEFIEGKLT